MSLFAGAMLALSIGLSGCKIGSDKKTSRGTSTRTNTSTSTTNTSVATARNVLVSWAPNRESAVNKAGGGYRIYYSRTDAGVDIGSATVKTVSYVSGALAPTSLLLPSLSSGNLHVKIIPFSARNTSGNTSTVTTLVVP